MAGPMVVLPLRALPDGTNIEALTAMLNTLRSGGHVAGMD